MAAETKSVEAKSIDVDGVFKVFTACPNDPKTLLLDVRDHKDFKRKHINQAYCIRLSKNGKVLADYSQSQYTLPWSQDCWCVARVRNSSRGVQQSITERPLMLQQAGVG